MKEFSEEQGGKKVDYIRKDKTKDNAPMPSAQANRKIQK
jgi:hypothetical protein